MAAQFVVLCSLLVFFISAILVSGAGHYRPIDYLNTPQLFVQSETTTLDVSELFFDQTLDHWTRLDTSTFPQRYFYSARYTRNNNSTTFLFVCVGGEGPALTTRVLMDSVHCTGDMLETARVLYETHDRISIELYALEHRFYGQSFPFENATTDHLVYLSSRQATADLAHFVRHQQAKTNSSQTILFGGSYPGMLAAFARLLYPHLIDGAVSNSAPVQARLDFSAYNGHIGRVALAPECQFIVQTGHAQLARNLTAYVHLFPLCDAEQVKIRRNLELWLGDGVVSLGVQGNDPACNTTYCNVQSKCSFLAQEFTTNGQDAVAALAALAHVQTTDCVTVDWSTFVDKVANVSTTPSDGGLRSWIWQTCTEFGFYQTCTTPDCPYAQGFHTLDQDLELCQKAFHGISLPDETMIANTNEWTGGWDRTESRILSLVGTIDPWTELAAKNAIAVPGASHHFWTHPVRPTDSKAVQHARELITSVVESWVLPEISSSGTTATSE